MDLLTKYLGINSFYGIAQDYCSRTKLQFVHSLVSYSLLLIAALSFSFMMFFLLEKNWFPIYLVFIVIPIFATLCGSCIVIFVINMEVVAKRKLCSEMGMQCDLSEMEAGLLLKPWNMMKSASTHNHKAMLIDKSHLTYFLRENHLTEIDHDYWIRKVESINQKKRSKKSHNPIKHFISMIANASAVPRIMTLLVMLLAFFGLMIQGMYSPDQKVVIIHDSYHFLIDFMAGKENLLSYGIGKLCVLVIFTYVYILLLISALQMVMDVLSPKLDKMFLDSNYAYARYFLNDIDHIGIHIEVGDEPYEDNIESDIESKGFLGKLSRSVLITGFFNSDKSRDI